MQKDDGGPAFPAMNQLRRWPSGEPVNNEFNGMTLRDWFAGQAMIGMVACWEKGPDGRWIAGYKAPEVVKQAYAIADAMIAERKG